MTHRIVIIGATSGIGETLTLLFVQAGWKVGIAGRREERLESLKKTAPESIVSLPMDVCSPNAGEHLLQLIEKLGGMDYYLHVSGIGLQNKKLEVTTELAITNTNAMGFVRMVDAAFNYLKVNGGGHIAAITSVAGTKGLGTAPAYSATKAFNNTYLQALAQLSSMEKLGISFTTIKPGFIATDLLNPKKKYPMMMSLSYASRIIFKALLRKKRVKIIDWRYAFLVRLLQFIPNALWERIRITN